MNAVIPTPASFAPPPSGLQPRKAATPLPLVGRSELVRAVAVSTSAHRVVTLVGAPGVGKSALARAAMPAVATVVSLAGCASEAEVEAALAGAPVSGLLVIDNAEAVLPALAAWIERSSASELHVLVTSFVPVGVAGEHVIVVPPLSAQVSMETASSEAAELLARCARGHEGDEVGVQAEHETLARIAGGFPQALVVLGDVLREHPTAERHVAASEMLLAERTCSIGRAGTVADSYRAAFAALDEATRTVLVSLSVFAGTFGNAEITAILGSDASAEVHALTETGLVIASADGALRMPLLVRAFARSSGIARDEAEHAHVELFLGRASQISLSHVTLLEAPEVSPELADVVTAIDRERARIDGPLAASERPLERLALALAGAPGFATERERASELLPRFATAESLTVAMPPDAASRFFTAWGSLLFAVGDSRGAIERFRRAEDIASDVHVRHLSRLLQGRALLAVGDLEAAQALLEDVAANRLGDLRAEAWRTLATLHAARGARSRAEQLARRALALHDATQTTPRAPFIITLANLIAAGGAFAEARALLERARDAARTAGRARWVAMTEQSLGGLALDEGSASQAAVHFERATELHGALGDAYQEAVALGYLGVASLLSGAVSAAIFRLQRASRMLPASAADLAFFRGTLAVAHARRRDNGDQFIALALLEGQPSSTEMRLLGDVVALVGAAEPNHRAGARRMALVTRVTAKTQPSNLPTRVAMRLLEGALRESERETPSLRLHVAADGSYLQIEGGERVSLERRINLRRIVAALVEGRRQSPGVQLSAPTLIEAGWPGERILPAAARVRLRVAMTTLRNLGLRDYLDSSRRGHALTAAIVIEDASRGAAA